MTTAAPAPTPADLPNAADHKLKRSLSLWHLTLLGVSTQIGSGWLFAVLSSASYAGPAAIVSWILGGVVFVIVSLTWIELGTMFPRSGAVVRSPALSHGAFTGWITGVGYWIGGVCLPAIEAQAALTYIGGRFPELGLVQVDNGTTMLAWPIGIVAGVGILAIFFVLNLFGVKLLAKVNTYVTIWKVVIPCLTFILLFFAFKSSNLTAGGGFFPSGPGGIVHSMTIGGIAFGYFGARQVLDYGGESRNPKRDIPWAIILSILIPMVVYVGLQIGFLGALDWADAGIAVGDWAALRTSDWASAPLFQALGAAGFGAFATVLLIDAAISPAGNGWVALGGSARTSFAFGVDKYAPKILTKVNRFGIPWVSLVVAIVVGSLFMLPFPSWYQLVSMVSVCLVLSYLMGNVIAPVLRRTAPDVVRGWQLRGMGIWAPVGFMAGLVIVYAAGFTSLTQLLVIAFAGLSVYSGYTSVMHGWVGKRAGWSISAVFFVAWVYITARGGWFMNTTDTVRPGSWSFPVYIAAMAVTVLAFVAVLRTVSTLTGRRHLDAGLWLITTLLGLLLVSYYGEFGPLSEPALAEPYDLLVMAVVALVSYTWAVRSGFHTEQLDHALDDPDTEHLPGFEPRHANPTTTPTAATSGVLHSPNT